MADEIELKLTVPRGALRRVEQLPWLREFVSGPAKREKLVSVYFDSRKFKLRDHGVSLRVRHIGRKRIQTIKASGNAAARGFGRQEWEDEISGDKPKLRLAEDTPLEPLATKKLKRRLRPIFETKVERVTMPIDAGDCQLELAIDRGCIRANEKTEAINEIELELKRGDPARLASIAQRLAECVSAEYGVRMKSERGYALAAGEHAAVAYPEDIVLDKSWSVGESFRVIGVACLRHFAANHDAIVKGDLEGVHQMRVGLRRLRAAMSVFQDLLACPETEVTKAGLKWLTDELGPARDFDVFVNEGVAPLENAMPDKPELGVLRADLSGKRRAGLARAKEAVKSDRYRQIVLKTALWLAGGDWSTTSDPMVVAHRNRSVFDFAAEVLGSRTKKANKKIRKLAKLDARRRHKVRIGTKKLRYAIGFFESLYSDGEARAQRRRFVKTLKTLQDALGRLNDISVHARLAERIVHARKQGEELPEKTFAIGILTGKEQSDEMACLEAAAAANVRLSKTPHFWR